MEKGGIFPSFFVQISCLQPYIESFFQFNFTFLLTKFIFVLKYNLQSICKLTTERGKKEVNMKKLLSFLLSAALMASLAACGDNNKTYEEKAESSSPERKTIAVTILPQKGLAEAVCGDRYEVKAVIPPGSSPENYEISPAEMEKLSKAQVLFSIGVEAENTKTFASIFEKVRVVPLHEKVAEKFEELTIDEGRDPHIWLSPKRAVLMVEVMADTLGEMYPEDKAFFKQNSESYIKKINEASDEIKEILKGREGETFICFHPAFNYFADEFSLNMMALEKHGKEATPMDLKEIIDAAKEKGIKTVFTQAETDSRQAKAFAEEIGANIVVLDPLSENYVENLKIMAEAFKTAK